MKKFLFIFLAIFALSSISGQVMAQDDEDLGQQLVNSMGDKKDPPKPTTKPTKTRRSGPKPSRAPAIDPAVMEALNERLEKIEEHIKPENITPENIDEFLLPWALPFYAVAILLAILWFKKRKIMQELLSATRLLTKNHKDENLKTKYDALKRDYDALKRDHDALEQRLQNLEDA